MFLVGIVIVSHSPPELPKQLTLDFNLIPQVAEEVPQVVETAPPVVEPVPVQKTPPPPPEVKPVPVEPSPPPPKIVEMVEPPPPVIEEVVPEVIPEPVPTQPVAVVKTEVPEETALVAPPVQTVAPAVEVDDTAVRAAAEAVQHEITVNHVRGEVLGRLNYPAVARKMGWCGKLILGFVLCADGSVEDLEVLESSGHKVLDRAAMRAVTANVPFSGGYPRTEVRLPINFQLD